MTEFIREEYDVTTIPLGATMTDEPFYFDANTVIIAQVPIEVTAKINDVANKGINLQIFRRLDMKVTVLFITTTDTSTTPLIIFASKNVSVGTSGFGSHAVLVDSLASEYDARLVKRTLADSTITNLADGATYTGAQFATDGYNKLVGSVYSNATGTLYVDQSQDGTNYDVIDTIAYVGAAVTGGFSVEIVAPYARVRYVDTAGTAQTSFRLFAYLSTGA
jgi:hypothetical protein